MPVVSVVASMGVSFPNNSLSGVSRRWAQVSLLALAALLATTSIAQAQSSRVSLQGHVLTALTQASSVTTTAAASLEPLTLTVVLRRSDPEGFARFLNDVYDQSSPQFRRFLTPAQVTERFGPAQADYDAVAQYFQAQGFVLGEGSANRMTLILNGTRADAARALAVNIADYRIGDRAFYASDAEPTLPPEIASRVEAIAGLSNLAKPTARPQPLLDHLPDNPANRALWYALCANEAINGGESGIIGAETIIWAIIFPADLIILNTLRLVSSLYDIYQAGDPGPGGTGQKYAKCVNKYNNKYGYGLIGGKDPPPPAWQAADGTGQTIGVVAFDTFLMSDVANYVALMGEASGPITNVSQVHVNGGAALGANQDEVLLDIADILTTAPGAHIVVYDAPFTGSGTSFQGILNAMIGGGVTIISNSWSYCEDQTTLADVQSIDSIFQTAAASGISAFNASGDSGSTCLDGSPNTAGVPATSPYATAVGGTSLQLYPGKTYGKETWWDSSASTPPGGKGGYGVSRFFARPAYQNGLTSSASRSIPDVAANADPAYGVKICRASAGGCPTGGLYGGTSSSTPMWAGFAAMLNQTQGTNLGFFNPQIYPFANTNSFHTPASMGSDFAHVGLGSPNLAHLHRRLTGQAVGPVSPSVSSVRAYSQTTFTMPEGSTTPLASYADGVTQTYIVVTLADANGIPLGGRNIVLSGGPGSHAVFYPSHLATDADTGIAIFFVTDTSVETITITATDTTDGIVLPETPKVQFLSPPAAAGSINAGPLNVSNNGLATTTITVTLKDANNNPSPGKQVQLLQGPGHSVINGPAPSVTSAAGTIQFTATNHYAETVTYTAVDVTDDGLAVPGSAVVTFGGQANNSCAGTPSPAAAGYTLTPFITGFATGPSGFGNLTNNCAGANFPAFASDGSVYVTNALDGSVYKLPPQGGSANASNRLSTLGPTLQNPVFGKDGRLYAARTATTGDYTTGALFELDPATGAIVRTVASPLLCPFALSVDPLSGDLFYDDNCFGGSPSSNDPVVYRVSNPASATPTRTAYTTVATPNSWMSFAPDGTLFIPQFVDGNGAPMLRVSGTNGPAVPTQTPVPGLSAVFWVTVAEVLPDGSAKSLLILAPASPPMRPNLTVRLADITTDPPTYTDILDGPSSTGVIGPDGCVYISGGDTIYKLAPTAGGCGFASTSRAPKLTLAPATPPPTPAQGTTQTLTATFSNVTVPAGTPVYFTINGVNAQLKLSRTNASGVATVSYVGALAGTDTVTASALSGAAKLLSNPTTVTWGAGKHITAVGLSSSPSASAACAPAVLTASLTDASVSPLAAIPGATVHFTLGAQSCNAVTNANGVASCSVNPPVGGQFTMTASYAGDATHNPAVATQAYYVPATSGGGTVPTCVVSRKVHGGAGTFELPLSLVATAPTVEPRQGTTHTIVFTFDAAVTSAGTATVTEGTAAVIAPAFSGNEVVVGLTGVSDRQYVTVTLANVVTATVANAGAASRVGFLMGDVNQNRVVTVSDLALVNQQLTQTVTASNFLKDINVTGTLTVADKGLTNSNLSQGLPPP